MPLDDRIHIQFMQDVREALGGLKSGQDSQLLYIENVSKKLNVHVDSETAHGQGARSTVWVTIGKSLAALAALITIALGAKALGVHIG